MVRPERVRISTTATPGIPSIPVTASSVIFQGPVLRLGLHAGDGTEIVAHLGAEAANGVAPGASLFASWDREAARLLPDENSLREASKRSDA